MYTNKLATHAIISFPHPTICAGTLTQPAPADGLGGQSFWDECALWASDLLEMQPYKELRF